MTPGLLVGRRLGHVFAEGGARLRVLPGQRERRHDLVLVSAGDWLVV
jgi:hypothetical protein